MILLEDLDLDEQFLIENVSRQEVLDMLKDQTVVVSFRKKSNNRQRLMYCTRDLNKIPRDKWPVGGGPAERDPNHIRVFDLVKKEWRSFRLERVKTAEPHRLGWLTRLLQRRKYTKDFKESVEENALIAIEVPYDKALMEHMGIEIEIPYEPEGISFMSFNESRQVPTTVNESRKVYVANIGDGRLYYNDRTGKIWVDMNGETVFTAEMYPNDEVELNNGRDNISIENPAVGRGHSRKGLGSAVYHAMSREFNVVMGHHQSSQGRAFWEKMIKSKNFAYVYMWDEYEAHNINGRPELIDDDAWVVGTSRPIK